MIYGYARVSTEGQSVAAQVKELRDAGAEKFFRVGTCATCPVGRSLPLAAWTWNVTSGIAVLVGREQKPAGGIDAEAAGGVALGRCVADICQPSVALIDAPDRDAVLTTIRGVENAPDGETWISAQVLAPRNPSGRVGTICCSWNAPVLRSKARAATVEFSSLTR